MNEPPIALVIAISVVMFLLIAGGTIYFRRDVFGALFGMIRSKVVAEAEVAAMPPYAFSLRHVCQRPGLHRVCLKLRLRSQSGSVSSSGPRVDVGLRCSYQVSLGGTVVAEEVVGYGNCPPKPFARHISMTFFGSKSNWGAGYTQTGTLILTAIERCPRGQEMVVEGSCEVDPGTQVEALVASLRA